MSLVNIDNGSILLNQLYIKYDLINITSTGVLTDILGDVYEDFILKIFDNKQVAMSWAPGTTERYIVDAVLSKLSLAFNDIVNLSASDKYIPPTVRGGTPKTDVYIKFNLIDGETHLTPISVKQSTVPRVSIAEYSVDDIVSILEIKDLALIKLLMKHQTDASAKNFTPEEKIQLKHLLSPYVDNLIRWCLTLNPNPTSQDIRHPEYFIKFDLNHPNKNPSKKYSLKSVEVHSIDEYINLIKFTAKGRLRSGGFGTGLSWTYATGSKGLKIQFKA